MKVTAGQLGIWNHNYCRFEPITWVAPAGALIYRANALGKLDYELPDGHESVGAVPNSDFPVHVKIGDVVSAMKECFFDIAANMLDLCRHASKEHNIHLVNRLMMAAESLTTVVDEAIAKTAHEALTILSPISQSFHQE